MSAKQNLKTQPHIKLSLDKKHSKVIVCGAPERAELIASFLKSPKLLAKNREYHSYLGTFKGEHVLVTSHGVGAAGAMICFQELIEAGAKNIIRVGTAGGLYAATKVGDVVVADSAIRLDGVSPLMVPLAYPSVPDHALTLALSKSILKVLPKAKVGTILTTDMFYAGVLDDQLELYSRANALAVDMEAAALFVVGRLKQIKTAAVFALDGNPISKKLYAPDAELMKKNIALISKAALSAVVTSQ
ncbi:MAG: nucleoside phosphorylase [Bdellovibrionota bacterium]